MQQEIKSQADERTQKVRLQGESGTFKVISTDGKESYRKTSAHTPAPWSMPTTKKGHLPIWIGNNNDGRTKQGFCAVAAVGDLMEGPMDYTEVVANATLIAAAPDLLTSLVEYIAAVDAYYHNPGSDDTGEKCAELVLVHERALATIAKATGKL